MIPCFASCNRNVRPKRSGLVFVFFFPLLSLCFVTAKLKWLSGGIDCFSVLSAGSCHQWKPMFSLTEESSGKHRPRGPVSSISSPVWGDGGDRERKQRFHKLVMVPYSWNVLSLMSGCKNSCDACEPCWAVLCGSWDMVFFFSGCQWMWILNLLHAE